jgi:hypothetical protein
VLQDFSSTERASSTVSLVLTVMSNVCTTDTGEELLYIMLSSLLLSTGTCPIKWSDGGGGGGGGNWDMCKGGGGGRASSPFVTTTITGTSTQGTNTSNKMTEARFVSEDEWDDRAGIRDIGRKFDAPTPETRTIYLSADIKNEVARCSSLTEPA